MRKLLGYRLKSYKEKYREAAESITGISKLSDRINFEKNSYAYDSIKQAGVMHWFEEVYEEEKLEVGKWYKDQGYLVCFQGYETYNSYGFRRGLWTDNWNITTNWEGLSLSTTEEIKQALIKEAKKRGFKEGVKFNNSKLYKHTPGSTNTIIGDFKYEDGHLSVKGYGGYCGRHTIFKDGKWAEILPAETLNGKTAIIDGFEYELKLKD